MLQKSQIQIIAYLVVVGSVLLNACAPLARTIVTASGSQSAPQIQYENPQPGSEQPTQTETPDTKSIEGLLDALKLAGVSIESVTKQDSTLLDSAKAFALKVATGELFVYEFGSTEVALAASQRIGPDGTEITGLDGSISSVRWTGAPHFWLHESFIILYLGEDEGLLASLGQALGKPFAGMNLSEDLSGNKNPWKEVWVKGDGFGFAVPCWWQVGEIPADGTLRSMTIHSYDDAFFQANSLKGEWKDLVTPDGAYKVDISIAAVEDPMLSTVEAYMKLIDPSLEKVVSSIEARLGDNPWTVLTLQNLVNSEDKPGNVYVNRLAQNELLIVAAYPWPTGVESSDVQAIISSFAFSSEQAVQSPTIEPHPPLIEASCVK